MCFSVEVQILQPYDKSRKKVHTLWTIHHSLKDCQLFPGPRSSQGSSEWIMPSDLPLSWDKFHASLERNKRLRERHVFLFFPFFFCSATLTVVLITDIDHRELKKKMQTANYGHSYVLYHLQWWVVLSSWLLIHSLCISHVCFSPRRSSVSLPAWFLSVVLHLSIFLIRLCWWMSLVLMTLCWCHGGVWLCPDHRESPESVWSSV